MDAEEMFAAGQELEERGQVGDLPAIEEWYRKAAEAGSVPAMGRLGLLLEGRTRARMEDRFVYSGDYAEAARWYRQAADAGDSWAAFALGRLHSDKLDDWSTAKVWYKRAAADGRWQAKKRLEEGKAGVARRQREDAMFDKVEEPPSTAAAGSSCLMLVALITLLPLAATLLLTT
ncbi:tetratricopeptide repeat protein [Kribbella sp. NPDC050124]|uniref:tetratricopeptide repeat protein n=1 Tax=Kribbella sp. NPDC050124 TaxID=3364114 RepID=UPI0037965113